MINRITLWHVQITQGVQPTRKSTAIARFLIWTGLLMAGCGDSTEPLPDPMEGLRFEAVTDTLLAGTVGTAVTPVPVVRITTRDGKPAPGVQIAWVPSWGGHITSPAAQTDQEGRATVDSWILGDIAGTQQLKVLATGLSNVVFTVNAGPGPVARIAAVSGNFQAEPVGATLTRPLSVKVTDWYNNPIPQFPVTFEVLSGGGTISGDSTVTDQTGLAVSGSWILGSVPGTQEVRAKANDVEMVFTATACLTTCQQLLELAFVRDDDPGESQLFTMDLLSRTVTQLTTGSGWRRAPTWSPDGRRIAYEGNDYNDYTGDILLLNADGSNRVRLAAGFGAPAWSPGGSWLAVHRGDCIYSCDIYVLNADDAAALPVHVTDMAAEPAWSPDGRKIAFVSISGDDGYHALHVVNSDGTSVAEIVPRSSGAINHPTWSPDGQQIAFAKCEAGVCDIFAVNADGTGLTQLTAVGDALQPAWSPDGSRIAFTLSFWEDPRVAYVTADGGKPPVVLTRGRNPAWRPTVPASLQ